ncbi:hypothetical protein GCM10017673_14610 [Streptosporangium violaceochromogenes]|nr:hypothetical protein GCM10017673_14610 [Streptosporangium violaceochromogenes]
MTTTPAVRTENDALIQAIDRQQVPDELVPGLIYGYKLGDRVEVVDLSDKHLERPRRKTGRVVVEDIASFVHYYKKHADTSSEVFVDIQGGVITAVLDAHRPTPDEDLDRDETARWGEHRLVLRLEETPAWKRWVGSDRQLVPQQRFAEFIDDNRADIRTPSAAEMLELVQHFQAVTKVTFNSATILANGNRRLVFTEETDAGAGTKGQIEVPSVLELGIAPFTDSEPYVVAARFRYRIQGGGLQMGILLDNADDVRRDAVSTVVTRLQDELGIQIMRGQPSS